MALDLGFPGAVDFIHDESGAQSNSVDDDIDSHSAIPAAAHLRLLTILDEWYPPARHDATSPPVTKQKSSSDVNRREKRWLLNAYPQAYAAAPDLGPHLTRERAYQRSVLITGGAPGGSSGSAAPPAPRALLAVGEMLDVSDVARRGTARLVAAVTGEAGQLLRLVRVTSERWKWSDDRLGHAGCSVSLLTQRDAEETVWHGEGSDDGRGSGNLPITQLKMARFTTPATGRNKLGVNTSWLLVQRASETAVLEPEYHGRRPVGPAEVVTGGHASAYGSAIPRPAGSPRMSSISTGVVATVTAAQTGLNAGAADHVDVDFNPPHGNAPPQIAIVDERGGWSVWDVAGRKTTFVDKRRAVLVACGVGFDGESERGWHRVLWVGKDSEPGDVSHGMLGLSLENDPHLNAERAEHAAGDAGQLVRSRVLLLCNTSVLTTVDVLSGESLARVRVADIFGCGRIIDVLRHPVKMNEIFVLTEAQLLWVDVFPLVNGGDGCQRMSVIQACDISGDYEPDEGLRLGTLHCGQRWPGDDRITVYIHSTKRQKLDIVSLFPARSGLSRPRCLKQQNCLIAGTHSLGVSYHHITRDTHFAEAEKQGKLLQLFVLKSDLSLHSATAAVWNDGEVAPLVLPDVQRNMGKRLAGRERAMEDFKRGFVVPDVYGDLFADVRDHATKPGDRPTLALVSTKSERKHRRWRNFEGLLDTALTYHRYSERIEGPGANLVDLALEYVQEAMEERPPSMDTFLNFALTLGVAESLGDAIRSWTPDSTQMPQMESRQVAIVPIGGPVMNFDTDMTPYGAIESHMLLQWTSPALSETLTPEQSSFRESMLRWVCDDLFLSSFALLITKRPPPPPATSPAGLLSPISSARGTRSPSLSQRDSGQGSRLPTPTPSEASGLTEEPREDPAITLLRPFAESIDSITAKHGHRSRLLSHWPEEPGIDPAKYTWTLRDIVPRRRRRSKSWASDVRSVSREPGSSQPTIIVPVTTSMQPIAAPPSTSQSQGGSQNRSEDSSQPLSSQAMSQPVAGVFTPRHLKGKPKKKRVRGF